MQKKKITKKDSVPQGFVKKYIYYYYAIFWLIKRYPDELSSSQIAKLTGSTKNTVEAIRNGTFREAILEAKSPMDTGLCTFQDLEKALNRAKNKKDRQEAEEAKAKLLAETESN